MGILAENIYTLLTLRNRHWYALKERFQTRPMRACLQTLSSIKISRFVVDSSRSYANWMLFIFLVVFL